MTADRGSTDRDRAREQLRTLQRLRAESFSPNAVDTLVERQAEYLEEVSREATRIARRNRSDLVSAADVEAADQRLHQAAAGRLVETLGAAVFGAGLSEFAVVMTTSHPGRLGIALGCGGMILGLAAVAFHRSGRD